MSRGTQTGSASRRRGLAVVAAGAALALAGAAPAMAHEADDEFKAGEVLAALAPQGEGVNMTAVANLPHKVATPQAAQNGSDIEFFRARGRDYALAGTLRNGLQINDISDPTAPVKTAVYDCPVNQGDIQVFRQGGRVLATYTADSRIGAGNLASQCVREANALGFGLDGTELGTFIVDLTRPSAPRTVGFAEVAQGSHNMTVHPSGNYLYNSNSDLLTNTTPDIAIFDIRDPGKPRLVQRYPLPFVPTSLGSNPHDIFFSPSGDRAYVAALSQTLILDTTNPEAPQRLPGGPAAPGAPSGGQIIDPAINLVHQSDTVTLTRRDGSDRTLLVITDERAGAAAAAECPGGGLHVYDVTGALERTPRKLGTWFIGHVGPVEPGEVCTSHVLRMHDQQALLTVAWYSQGVRVLDIAGLADYEPPAGQGDTAVAYGNGIGMTEIGSYVFSDADTWSFKTNAIARDGSFYGYGNDLNRGMDVYRFTPGEARPTTPLQPVDLLGGATGSTSLGGGDTSLAAPAVLPAGVLALLAAMVGMRRRSQRDVLAPGVARAVRGRLAGPLPPRRPGRRAVPVALVAVTGVLVSGAAAVTLTVATVESTEGVTSTKAVTLGGLDELRGQV